MSIVTIPKTILYGFPAGIATIAFNNVTLNASGDRYAFIVTPDRSAELDWFEWRTGTVSNNPDNGMKTSFQDVDPATGLPDTTADQFRDTTGSFSSNAWQVPAGVMTNDGTNGGTKRTSSLGVPIACVVDFVSFVAGDSIQVAVLDNISNLNPNIYNADGSTGAYAKSTSTMPVLALKYADGSYQQFIEPAWPFLTINHTAFASNSTPDERALLFVPEVTYRVVGAFFRGIVSAAMDLILYDSANNVLGTKTLDPDIKGNTGNGNFFVEYASFNITAGGTYRLAAKPTTTTSITLANFDVNANALLAAVPGGITTHGSTRTDAGAWSAATANRPIMGLVVDGIDIPSGGGGGSFAFMG